MQSIITAHARTLQFATMFGDDTEASLLAALASGAVDAAFVNHSGAPMEKPTPLLTKAVAQKWLSAAEHILTILEERADDDDGLCAHHCQDALIRSCWMQPVALTPDFQRQGDLVHRMLKCVKKCDHASELLRDALTLQDTDGLVHSIWDHMELF